jgi:hypothetical protein
MNRLNALVPWRSFHISELDGLNIVGASNADISMEDSGRSEVSSYNPYVVEKGRDSVASLFSNWEQLWPKSFRVWTDPHLRLVVGQQIDIDLWTGKERLYQHWIVVNEHDFVVAFVAPKGGSDDLRLLPIEKLCVAGEAFTPFLAEPYRNFISLKVPSRISPQHDWMLPPDLDLPGGGPLLEDAVIEFTYGKKSLPASVYDRIGTEDLRCYLVSSGGDFVLYDTNARHSSVYVVNVNDLNKVETLADPENQIDSYVSSVLAAAVSFKG